MLLVVTTNWYRLCVNVRTFLKLTEDTYQRLGKDMKILIAVMSVLFLNPVAAQSFGLYERSGGYESSGGYERSGGYESSGGYERSGGYDIANEGYEFSREGYERFMVNRPESTSHRLNSRDFDQQIEKSESRVGEWIINRHNDTREGQSLHEDIRRTGGVEDLVR